MTDPEMDCRCCRDCGTRMQIVGSRQVDEVINSQRRRKVCPKCGARYTTVEIPEDLFRDIFEGD